MATKANVVVNFNQIEADIAAGNRVTTKDLAKAYMVSPVTLRKMLADHFGSRIEFKRGRSGGIVLDGAAAAQAAGEAPAPVFPYGMD
jgi:predicted DNA-binding transcriptional regulator YafY